MLAAGALLFLMFTTPDAPDYKEGLFGAVFFKSTELPDGGVGVSMGVAEPWVLVAIFAVITVLLLLVQVIFLRLRRYRQGLIEAEKSRTDVVV